MDRRRFIGALVGGSILAAPLAAGTQQAGKVYRIGVQVPGSSAAAAPFVGMFRQGLRELGFVEGKNLVIELRYAAAGRRGAGALRPRRACGNAGAFGTT